MRIRTLGLAVAAGALALPATGLAGNVRPDNGKFTGTPHYKVAGKTEKGSLTITVAKHKITEADFLASIPPIDTKHSKGPACGAANAYPTKGYKRVGTTSASGQFNYTFTQKGKGFSDTISLVGRFTDPTHATGTWRDQLSSSSSNSHCDSGKVRFSVTHS